jgi:DNA-binding NtrC family response regulator
VKARLLVVEDERAIRLALAGLLRKQSYDVTLAGSGDDAIARLAAEPFDLVLTDLALGDGKTGMDVLARALDAGPGTPVVLITAHGSEKVAVAAMKAGATDYVPKPFDNDEILLVVERALDRTRLEREHRLLLERVQREHGLGNLVGTGPAMQRVFSTIEKVAATDLTVLVRGESGTGKELVAKALHDTSPRKNRPFVAVNSAAISRELVESELFGHERGAFTGADTRRTGRFEAAHQGTLFLDEIGDMPLDTQAKLLRVLQERKFERVGGRSSVSVDVRVVAATHRDLEAEVKASRFREDLYYRLRVVEIALPPLRERRQDVPALALRFVTALAERLGRAPLPIDDAALARLARHDWPGNVRELENVVQQALVLASGPVIGADDLRVDRAGEPLPARDAALSELPFAEAKRRAVQAFERSYLERALRAHDGNISRTAEAIGMVRQSLQQKIRELGLRTRD